MALGCVCWLGTDDQRPSLGPNLAVSDATFEHTRNLLLFPRMLKIPKMQTVNQLDPFSFLGRVKHSLKDQQRPLQSEGPPAPSCVSTKNLGQPVSLTLRILSSSAVTGSSSYFYLMSSSSFLKVLEEPYNTQACSTLDKKNMNPSCTGGALQTRTRVNHVPCQSSERAGWRIRGSATAPDSGRTKFLCVPEEACETVSNLESSHRAIGF